MRKFILPLVLVASFGASSLAMAAATTTDGVIKSIDTKAMSITLQDGKSYTLPASQKLADLKAGEKVKVTWDKVGAAMAASKIEVVK